MLFTFAARSAAGRRLPRWLAVAVVAVLLALAALAPAQKASANGPKPLHAKLLGVFAFGPCPAGAPEGAACLHDRVSGTLERVGKVSGEFDVAIDAANTGPDDVAPIAKEGSFVARNGDRLDVSAAGTFDFTTSTATYSYTVTGGTGRFADALGSGTWLVPAPAVFDPATGRGSGDEFLDGTLSIHD